MPTFAQLLTFSVLTSPSSFSSSSGLLFFVGGLRKSFLRIEPKEEGKGLGKVYFSQAERGKTRDGGGQKKEEET